MTLWGQVLITNLLFPRLSVPVVTSLYLLCRVWWVLSIMERVGLQASSSTNMEAEQENTRQESTDSIVNLDNNNDRWGEISYPPIKIPS